MPPNMNASMNLSSGTYTSNIHSLFEDENGNALLTPKSTIPPPRPTNLPNKK